MDLTLSSGIAASSQTADSDKSLDNLCTEPPPTRNGFPLIAACTRIKLSEVFSHRGIPAWPCIAASDQSPKIFCAEPPTTRNESTRIAAHTRIKDSAIILHRGIAACSKIVACYPGFNMYTCKSCMKTRVPGLHTFAVMNYSNNRQEYFHINVLIQRVLIFHLFM